jgi:hypothetical protein
MATDTTTPTDDASYDRWLDEVNAMAQMTDDQYQAFMQAQFDREDAALARLDAAGVHDDVIRDRFCDQRDRFLED